MKSFTEFTKHKAVQNCPDLIDNHLKLIGKVIKSMAVSDGGDTWIINFEDGSCAVVDAGIDSSNAKDAPIARVSIVYQPEIKKS